MATLTVYPNDNGLWRVEDECGTVVVDNLTQVEAWDWVERKHTRPLWRTSERDFWGDMPSPDGL